MFKSRTVCMKDSDGQLELGEVPLVHVVVSHQLVAPGELLLTVWPPAVKRLLTWEEGWTDRWMGRWRRKIDWKTWRGWWWRKEVRRGFGRMHDRWNNSEIGWKEKGEMREILQYYTDYNLNKRLNGLETILYLLVRINTHWYSSVMLQTYLSSIASYIYIYI